MQLSKVQTERLYIPLMQSLADVNALNAYCRAEVSTKLDAERRNASPHHEEDVKRAKENHARAISNGETVRDERLHEINETYAQQMVEVQTNQAREMRQAIEAHEARMVEIPTQSQHYLGQLDQEYQALKQQVLTRHETRWNATAERWRKGDDIREGRAHRDMAADR